MTSVATPGDALAQAVAHVAHQSHHRAEVGLVLGTGLGALAARMDIEAAIPYDEIPHMPVSTVASHEGRLLLGTLAGRRVAVMQGRYHHYEGHALQQVALPIRLLRRLGAHTLVLSGACGGLNPLWQAGDLALVTDHINLMGDNPLVGPNDDTLGARFPDMTAAYDPVLHALAAAAALRLGIPLRQGVYAAVAGPNLETRAEYRMLRAVGADLVGMSTVPEVITARHAGMRVLAVSVVTDMCLPDALHPTDIETIIAHATRAEPALADLLCAVLGELTEPSPAATAAPVGDGETG